VCAVWSSPCYSHHIEVRGPPAGRKRHTPCGTSSVSASWLESLTQRHMVLLKLNFGPGIALKMKQLDLVMLESITTSALSAELATSGLIQHPLTFLRVMLYLYGTWTYVV